VPHLRPPETTLTKILHRRRNLSNLKRLTRMDVAFTIHSFSFRRKKEENGLFYPEFVPSATNGRKLEVNRCL